LENVLRHSTEVNNPKQMALDEPIPSTMVVGNPRPRKSTKPRRKRKGT
jgi:hypothetical protein